MTLPARCPSFRERALAVSLLASLVIGLVASPASAVVITIKSTDGPGEGFNDPKPVAPVGGNSGATLGAQRLILFQHAADAWALRLGGTIPVVVSASFSGLGGTAISATLGYAHPTTVHVDFPGAPVSKTWYIAGLANQLSGTDQNASIPAQCGTVPTVNGNCPDIKAEFNSDVDGPEVLGAVGFYYGIDGNSGGNIDFLTVILHEIGHGLGVLTLTDPNTGQKYYGFSDAYANRMEDIAFSPREFSKMTDEQRFDAMRDNARLVFKAPAMLESSSALNDGVRNDGAVQLYAPTIFEPGSSVSHLDTDVSPNELMEPFYTNPPPRNLTISLALLKDLGWTTVAVPKCGDANDDTRFTTSDALVGLKTAVGSGACPRHVCDVNLSGAVTTSDALVVLKRAVGQNVTFACPLA